MSSFSSSLTGSVTWPIDDKIVGVAEERHQAERGIARGRKGLEDARSVDLFTVFEDKESCVVYTLNISRLCNFHQSTC
jgi:hypothetical protein